MRELVHPAVLTLVKGVVALVVVLIAGNYFWDKYVQGAYYAYENPYCNIAVVPIEGGISTIPDELYFPVAADRVLADLRAAELDPYTEGILVRIDSPGGTLVASELITDAVRRTTKPTIALIREIGTSGGYLVATGADAIIASPNSSVGSIGVTSSYIETAGQLESEGGKFIELVSAPYKEAGNPDRPLSEPERELFVRDLTMMHESFVSQVARNRSLPIEEVRKIADGSSVLGVKALELGLIDMLGDQETARSWFSTQLNTLSDFCEPPPPLPATPSYEEASL
jgi:protease-4